MQSGGHFSQGTRYGPDKVSSKKHGILEAGFLNSLVAQSLRPLVYGKKVLDIGCGVGDWCSLVAQYGAQTVDGFDIQVEMVELAKQATSHLDMVHIQVGDAAEMPYNDASFDVALSFYITCNLSPEAYKNHFQEIYRVLVPGGKAVFLLFTDWCNSKLCTKLEADPATVEKDIEQVLANMPKFPNTAQLTEAFKDLDDILIACFALDPKGNLFLVKNVKQLTEGQPIWRRTEVMMYPNLYYSDCSSITQMLAAGFHIDSVENYFTEERRVAYNNKNPTIALHKNYVKYSPVLMYCVSKPE